MGSYRSVPLQSNACPMRLAFDVLMRTQLLDALNLRTPIHLRGSLDKELLPGSLPHPMPVAWIKRSVLEVGMRDAGIPPLLVPPYWYLATTPPPPPAPHLLLLVPHAGTVLGKPCSHGCTGNEGGMPLLLLLSLSSASSSSSSLSSSLSLKTPSSSLLLSF